MLKVILLVLCSFAFFGSLHSQTQQEQDFTTFIKQLDFKKEYAKYRLELNPNFLRDYTLIWVTNCGYSEHFPPIYQDSISPIKTRPCFDHPKFIDNPSTRKPTLDDVIGSPGSFLFSKDSLHVVRTTTLILQHGSQISDGVKHSYFYRKKKKSKQP
jgi:hypothetical protein